MTKGILLSTGIVLFFTLAPLLSFLRGKQRSDAAHPYWKIAGTASCLVALLLLYAMLPIDLKSSSTAGIAVFFYPVIILICSFTIYFWICSLGTLLDALFRRRQIKPFRIAGAGAFFSLALAAFAYVGGMIYFGMQLERTRNPAYIEYISNLPFLGSNSFIQQMIAINPATPPEVHRKITTRTN